MPELLKFEFYRIKKNPLFWVILGLCAVAPMFFGIFVRVFISIFEAEDGDIFDYFELSKNQVRWLTWYASSFFYERLPLAMAIFTPLFIGKDYKDGIIRNKIIAGHTRLQIFATSIIVHCSVVSVFSLAYFLSGILGMCFTPFGPNVNGGEMFVRGFVLLLSLCATTILIVALSLSIKNRVLALVIAVVFVSTFNFWASFASSYSYNEAIIDDYLELYEDKIDEMDWYYDDVEDMIPSKKQYFGADYYIGHTIYVLTNASMGNEFIQSFSTLLDIDQDLIPEYSNKISREESLSSSLIKALFMDDFLSYFIRAKDIRAIDGVLIPVSQAEVVYTVKSVVWSSIYALSGYAIFRKKNLF